MKLSQKQKVVICILILGIITLFGSYYFLYPTIQNGLERKKIRSVQKEMDVYKPLWDSLMLSWKPWKEKYHTNPFSPDSLVSFALGASVVLHHFQVESNGNEYRFQVEGDFYSIFSFIQTIGKKAPDWFFKQFELVKSSKPNVYFLNQVCLRRMNQNTTESSSQKIQEFEVKDKLGKLISAFERNAHQQNADERNINERNAHELNALKRESLRLKGNPFDSEKKVSPMLKKKKPRCLLPSFQIRGAIAGRVFHLQGTGNKTIYKVGDFIGDYRVHKIETNRVLLSCEKDTVSRSL